VSLEAVYQQYKEKAAIFVVYTREAYPSDGRKSEANVRGGIDVKEPVKPEEREQVAATCTKELDLSIPCLVDGMDNAVELAYAGWPARLYVIDVEGKIAFKGKPGPGGFKPYEAEAALRALLGTPDDVPPVAYDERGLDRFHAQIPVLFKAAGAGASGTLDRAGFVELVPALRQAYLEMAPRNVRPGRRDEILSNEAMLLKYDKDGDGRLSAEERKVMEEDEKAEIAALFDKVDADRSGTVTEAEIRAALPLIIGPTYRDPREGRKP
jgi:hypothetical protein